MAPSPERFIDPGFSGAFLRRFAPETFLGRGTRSDVYRMRDLARDCPVAVKVPRHGVPEPLPLLAHPNVVAVQDAGRDEGLSYIVCEFLPESLAERLEQGPLPVPEALRIMAQVLRGLEAAHDVGLVHGELEPESIRFKANGEAALGGLGFSSDICDLETFSGYLAATPAAVSPERWNGATASVATDLYAAGVLLYQLVTGRVPFAGPRILDFCRQHLELAPDLTAPEFREPYDLVSIIRKALEKEPERRHPSAGQFALQLEELLDGASVRTVSVSSSTARTLLRTQSRERRDDALLARIMRSGEFGRRYEVQGRLGAGTFGLVLRASRREDGLPVAIKVLRQAEPAELLRFRREARILESVRHPNVVRLVDFGEVADSLYLALELLEGGSLRSLLGRTGPLGPAEAVKIAIESMSGLAECHDRGIIHRDLKPENILFDASEMAKVADLGIALVYGDEQRLTRTGVLCGTPRYIAPEQIRGEPASPAIDLYAMGVILYEMLAGQVPFPAHSLYTLFQQHLSMEPEPLERRAPGVPKGLAALVHRLLAKGAGARPGVKDLVRELTEIRAQLGSRKGGGQRLLEPEAHQTRQILRAPRISIQRRHWIVVGLLACMVIIAPLLRRQSPNPVSGMERLVEKMGTDAARKLLEERVRANPHDATAQLQLGLVLNLQGENTLARACYDSARKSNEVIPAALAEAFWLGMVEREAEVLPAFLKAAGKAPECRDIQQQVCEYYLVRGRLAVARREIARYKALDTGDPGVHRTSGLFLETQFEIREAEREFRKAVAVVPGSSTYLACLADFLSRHDRTDEALSLCREAIRLDPGRDDHHRILAQILERRGRYREALLELESTRAKFPRSFGCRMGMAHVKARQGELSQARTLAQEALGLDPVDCGPRLLLADLFRQEGRLEEAAAECRRVIAVNRSLPGAHIMLGRVFQQRREFLEAEREFREARRLDPYAAGAHSLLTTLMSSRGNAIAALQEYRQLVKEQPDNDQARAILAHLLWRQGHRSEASREYRDLLTHSLWALSVRTAVAEFSEVEGDFAGAERLYRSLHEAEPQGIENTLRLAAFLDRRQKGREAGELFARVIQGEPRDFPTLNSLASSRSGAGNVGKLLDLVILAMVEAPGNSGPHRLRAAIASSVKNLTLAESSYRRAIALNPNDLEARHLYAEFLEQWQRPKEARDQLRAAFSVGGGQVSTCILLAGVLSRSGDPAGAERVCRHAIAAEPGAASAHFELARLLSERSRRAEAEATYRNALKLNMFPDDRVLALSQIGRNQLRSGGAAALQTFQQALALVRDPAAVRVQFAGFCFGASRFEEARVLLAPVLEESKPSEPALFLLAACAKGANRRSEAGAVLRRLIRLYPMSEQGHLELSRQALSEGNVEEFTRESLIAQQLRTKRLTTTAR